MADRIGIELTGDNSKFQSMIDGSVGAVGAFNSALGKIGLGIGLAGVGAFFKSVLEKAGSLQDLSDRLGASTNALQSFDYTVRQAGGSSEQAVQAWDKGRKALDNLAIGNAAATEQFAALGLSARSFVGLNLEESLELIARGFVENKDAAGAYDAITDILGSKSAPALMSALISLGTDGFGALIDAAQQAGQVIESDTIKKLDEAGDHIEMLKGKLTVGGSVILGWAAAFTDVLGTIAANMVNKFKGLDIVPLEESAKRAVVAVEKVLPPIQSLTAEGKKQIVQEMEKSRMGDEQLERTKRLALLRADLGTIEEQLAQSGLTQYETDGLRLMQAETKKLIKKDEQALDAEQKKHAETMEGFTAKELEAAREMLTTEEQMAALRDDEAGWLEVLKEAEIGSEVRRHAEIELAKTRAEMRDVEKKRVQEIADIDAGRVITDTSLTRSQLERLEIQQKQHLIVAAEVESAQIRKGAVNGLTTAEIERLNVLHQQSAELENQIRLAQQFSAVTRTGKGYDQQSDDNLEGVRNRLDSQIQKLKRDSFGQSWGVGGTGKTPELYLLENELFNLNKERDERKEVSDYAERFGESKTRQKFGDTLTDKVLRDFNNDASESKLALQDIQARIAKIFPKT